MSHTEPHDEFLELCAVSTSGQLTEAERKKLEDHLAICSSCREALNQYQAVVDVVIPAVVAAEEPGDVDPGPNWSQERAEAALFERISRLDKIEKIAQMPRTQGSQIERPTRASRSFPFADTTWRSIWVLYAAGVALFVTLGLLLYPIAKRHAVTVANSVSIPPTADQNALEEQLSDISHERELARAQVQERDRLIADLRRQLEQATAAVNEFKTVAEKLENDLRTDKTANADADQRRTELQQKLTAAESSAQLLQQKLDTLAQRSSHDAAQAAGLEARVNDLTRQLRERDATIDQQQDLLARDRDIRELMGARDLYIAEVHDVSGTGATSKPYGRVFYTKGKSLIFYAYDLDQQKLVKADTTFQAWGRRGPNWQQALPLGIFYEDNAAKKRWVLKLDDPKLLAQIDAVFVTVEPNGGSRKPNQKPLLFAYLQVAPNHP